MKYYYPFHIDNWEEIRLGLAKRFYHLVHPQRTIYSKMVDWTPENMPGLYPIIMKDFDVIKSRMFYTPPKGSLKVHVDGTSMERQADYWGLNIPVIRAESNHWHRWFSYDGEVDTEYTKEYNYATTPRYHYKLKLEEKLTILTPHVTNVGVFHDVFNQSEQPRLMLSVRFRNKLDFSKFE